MSLEKEEIILTNGMHSEISQDVLVSMNIIKRNSHHFIIFSNVTARPSCEKIRQGSKRENTSCSRYLQRLLTFRESEMKN